MSGAATIVIARDDLSIAGAAPENAGPRGQPDGGHYLFELIHSRRPDVIVLDCRGPERNGVVAIEKIRARTAIPILAICEADDPLLRQYRIMGAIDCLVAPFDILGFNNTVQEIARLAGRGATGPAPQLKAFHFAGIRFEPRQNTIAANGASVKLTTAENHLLAHFAQRPGEVCSRAEIAKVLYGPHRPISDRAVDVIVARLRRKLSTVQGENGDNLVKTEFRRGYMFVGDVVAEAPSSRVLAETTAT